MFSSFSIGLIRVLISFGRDSWNAHRLDGSLIPLTLLVFIRVSARCYLGEYPEFPDVLVFPLFREGFPFHFT